MSRAAIPTPADGDGKQRPTYGSCFLTKPCCVPSSGPGCHHAREWRQRVGDRQDEATTVLPTASYSPCVGPVRQKSLPRTTGQELRLEKPPRGAGHCCPVRPGLGDLWDLCPLGRCRGSGCAHAVLGRTPANLLPVGARLSRDGPTSVPYWLLWARDRAEKHHN